MTSNSVQDWMGFLMYDFNVQIFSFLSFERILKKSN